ncbi:MAG: hypothetical protein M3P49_11030, partial [Actinomycetota bacterium]|nr:hypothetical protein [Actinomycetota bacterium]
MEDLPAFSKDAGSVVAVEDGVPENGVVHKVVSSATPRHFAGLAGVTPKSRGVVRLDKKARVGAVSYVRANSRTPTENPEEYLSFRASSGEVVLSGKALDLRPSGEAVGADARALLEYFGGFSLFRGESEKLARDYFAFWSWLWFGPFMCDLRNRAQAGHDHVHDYPIFGILYGKSNCGKSELVDTLQRSMFGRHGTAQNDWFTTNRVANLMAENRRYPLVFDDLGRDRYSKYAVDLIKEDHVRLPEYPVVVLSMNAAQDAFETEVRKRSFVVYTGASLPDDDPGARDLGRSVKRIKAGLGTAFYREYLRRLLPRLTGDGSEGPTGEPVDYLALSSSVIVEIVSEHHEG